MNFHFSKMVGMTDNGKSIGDVANLKNKCSKFKQKLIWNTKFK